jgi:hypothetical protein
MGMPESVSHFRIISSVSTNVASEYAAGEQSGASTHVSAFRNVLGADWHARFGDGADVGGEEAGLASSTSLREGSREQRGELAQICIEQVGEDSRALHIFF